MKQLNKDNLQAREAFSDYSYKAESDGKFYLLKFASVENAETAERIVSELREKLSSEFEIYRDDEKVVVAREFIEGALPEPKTDSPMEALKQIIEIAEALGGRLHGNLKPENILRNEDGNWMIIDSGIRAFHGLVRKNLGTGLQYLAPEQIHGEGSEKSDVYALGMLLGKLLCGNTPFDGKPEDLLVQEKQQGTTDWSIIADRPEELKKLVEKATANDTNSRHQSIAEFLEDCRRAERLLVENTATPSPTPSPLPEDIDDNVPLNPNKRFVLVGHTGAGKTVLAAGLYATFSRSKSLSVEAADEPTKQLANNFKSILETGTWPAATTGAAQKLCFRIAHNRDAAELDFDEYMGERVGDVESYIRDILKEPNGVLLLMNPGGLQFQLKEGADDTQQELAVRRNKLLSDLKSIIDYLFKLKTRPAVALVITASDRLKTDLKDFAPEFNRYVEEIETALDTRDKNWWKRFEVSVCGELADQTHPKLNPQGIDEPFLWLTERYNAVVRKKRITKFLAQTACGLSALALSAAAWWGVDWYRASAPERATRACIAEFSGKNKIGELGDCAQKLVGIRRGYCTENHITENHGKRVKTCGKTCSPFFLYPDRKREFEKNIRNLELAIDATRASYFEAKVNLALEKATEENCRVAEDVAGWIPLQAPEIEARFNELKAGCETKLPVARERYACSVFEDEAEKLSSELKRQNPKRIDDLFPLVEKWDAFKKQENVYVKKELVEYYRKSISEIVSRKIRGVLDELCAEYRERQLDTEEDLTPSFEKDWRNKILPLTPEFREDHEAFLAGKLKQIESEWYKRQVEKQIRAWVEKRDAGAREKKPVALEVTRDLKPYYLEHKENTAITRAEEFVHNLALHEVKTMLKNWKSTKKEYEYLKELCSAITASPSPRIQKSKLYRFAHAYTDWLVKYSRRVKITAKTHEEVADGPFKNWGKKYIKRITSFDGSRLLGFDDDDKKEKIRECEIILNQPWQATLRYAVKKYRGSDDSDDNYSRNYETVGMLKVGESLTKREYQLDITITALNEKTVREIYDEVFNAR